MSNILLPFTVIFVTLISLLTCAVSPAPVVISQVKVYSPTGKLLEFVYSTSLLGTLQTLFDPLIPSV